MSDWKKWCRLCANVESIEDVSIDLKQSISSIFELNISLEDLVICASCNKYCQGFIEFYRKAKSVSEMFEKEFLKSDEISDEEMLYARNMFQELGSEIELIESEIVEDEGIIIETLNIDQNEEELKPEAEDPSFYYPNEAYKLKCERCGKIYKTEAHYKNHVKACLTDVDPSTRKFYCEICLKVFKENRHLSVHMKTHLPDDEKYTNNCSICDKKYSSVFSLRQHIKVVHINNALFKCEYCSKEFSRKANLDSHLNVHSIEKRYECDICSLKLKTKANLRIHKKLHSTDPNDLVVCKVCKKQFKTSNQLTNHMITHCEVKKFACRHCQNVSYKRSKELQSHMLAVHLNIRKYSCKWCSRSFASNSNFRKHRKTAHPKELEEFEKNLKSDEIKFDEAEEIFIVEEF